MDPYPRVQELLFFKPPRVPEYKFLKFLPRVQQFMKWDFQELKNAYSQRVSKNCVEG